MSKKSSASIWRIPLIIFSVVAAIILLDLFDIRASLVEVFGLVKIETEKEKEAQKTEVADLDDKNAKIEELEKKLKELTQAERDQKEKELDQRIKDLEKQLEDQAGSTEAAYQLAGEWRDLNSGAFYTITQFGNELAIREYSLLYNGTKSITSEGQASIVGDKLKVKARSILGESSEFTLNIINNKNLRGILRNPHMNMVYNINMVKM